MLNLGDYFQFAIGKTDKLEALLEGAAVRYPVSASLASRPFEEVTLNVGFEDPPVDGPERFRGLDLLRFADIEPSEVPAARIEPQVAERLHAYMRAYASGQVNARVKDLIDLLLIGSLFPFQASHLRSALRAAFDARGSQRLQYLQGEE